MTTPTVLSVHAGRIAPLGPDKVPSAFVKHPIAGPVQVTAQGVVGDMQADLSVHGGPDKAVYGYSADHYPAWRSEFPRIAALFGDGSVGENLAITGLQECDLCVGDVHAIGSTQLQVCQPRQPCFKLGLRFDNNRLPKAMVRSGRSGWYYRVLQEGSISAGDSVMLHHRPNPGFPFVRLVTLIYHGGVTVDELERMVKMEGLAGQWQEHAKEALAKFTRP